MARKKMSEVAAERVAAKKTSAAARTLPLVKVDDEADYGVRRVAVIGARRVTLVEADYGVRRVAVIGARRVTLVEADDALWTAPGTPFSIDTMAGSFIRLRPPQGAEERAREVESICLAGGALGVKVELAARDRAVGVAEEARVDPRATLRSVVLDLAEKANPGDRRLFAASIEEGLAVAGL